VTVVVDASVALKWVVEEAGSQEARELLDKETLVAPELLFCECANVLWALARRKQISQADAVAAFAAIEGAPIRPVSSRAHVKAAQGIAFDLDQPVYDCLYLAVALAERAIVVTADNPFLQAAAAHAIYRGSVRALIP
jgi:predicted nucleic acid-binding protein